MLLSIFRDAHIYFKNNFWRLPFTKAIFEKYFYEEEEEEEEEEEDFAYTLRSVAWELIPLFGPWSRRGLTQIKPVGLYDPDRPDGRLNFDSQRL